MKPFIRVFGQGRKYRNIEMDLTPAALTPVQRKAVAELLRRNSTRKAFILVGSDVAYSNRVYSEDVEFVVQRLDEIVAGIPEPAARKLIPLGSQPSTMLMPPYPRKEQETIVVID